MTGAGAHARVIFPALGTTALCVVTDRERLADAERMLREELVSIDEACSRFRSDSEISRLHTRAGRPVSISPLLTDALAVALRAARLTDGLVDPTVGSAVAGLGYDRDYAAIDHGRAPAPVQPAPGWWRVTLDVEERRVVLPRGVQLDLGATAKALAADRAADRIASALRCGVLVSLGGDIATAGAAPSAGWRIDIADDHRATGEPDAAVTITSGGLATSSIACRSWRSGDRVVHHIVDPRTGDIPEPVWRTVSVAAGSCVDANIASTAAIVLGESASDWLRSAHLPARLVRVDGDVATINGWPDEAPGDRDPKRRGRETGVESTAVGVVRSSA